MGGCIFAYNFDVRTLKNSIEVNSMAKKKTEPKVKKNHLRDERIRLVLGVSIVLFSIFLFIAFFSFLFTWKQDQSISWDKLFSGSSLVVDNWSGKMGALFANLFMNNWFLYHTQN